MTNRYPPKVKRYLETSPGAGLHVRIDECKRVSRCRLCEDPIVKGSNRLTFHTTVIGNGQKPSSGKGTFYTREFFYHPGCFSKWLLPEDRTFVEGHLCFECGLPMHLVINRVYAGKQRGNKYLCGVCVKLPCWRFCQLCQMYAHRYDTSPILVEDMKTGHFACDHCVEEERLQVVTVKSRKRERREAREGTDSRPPSPASEFVVPF